MNTQEINLVDETIREQCIKFAEWCSIECYEIWLTDGGKYWIQNISEAKSKIKYSTEDLYYKYLHHIEYLK